MYAPRLDREAHVTQSLDPGEELFYPPQFKEWNLVHAAPLLLFETILAWGFGNVNQKMRNNSKTLAKKNLTAENRVCECKFPSQIC